VQHAGVGLHGLLQSEGLQHSVLHLSFLRLFSLVGLIADTDAIVVVAKMATRMIFFIR